MNWIKTSDKLPENGNQILVFTDFQIDEYLYKRIEWDAHYDIEDKIFYDHCCVEVQHVTHWMPLPEPPKEEK